MGPESWYVEDVRRGDKIDEVGLGEGRGGGCSIRVTGFGLCGVTSSSF